MIKRAIAASALAIGMVSAHAAAVFTDRTSFEAALAGTVTTETFGCGGCSFVHLGAGSVNYHGVNYATTGGNDFLIGTHYSGQTVSGTEFMQIENRNAKLTFGSGIRAIGMDVDYLFADYTFTLNFGGESISAVSTANAHRFLGIIADASFTEATITTSGSYAQFDNLTTATDVSLAVPEPGSLALALPLFGALALSRRRSAGTAARQ